MLEIKCLECNYDITSLFKFDFSEDQDGLPKVVIGMCPDCDTRHKLVRRKKQWVVDLVDVKKPVRTFYHSDTKVMEITVIGRATDQEIADAHRIRCGQCNSIVHLFMSYLVKLRGTHFPKVVTTTMKHDPDGTPRVDREVSYRPPNPIKTRLCSKCFNLYPPGAFIKDAHGTADIEQLHDPINMMRDGTRFVPISPSMKAAKYEVDIIERELEPPGPVYTEGPVLELWCRPEDTHRELLFRPSHYSPGETYKVAVPVIPRRTPYKPKPQYMRVHATRTVRWKRDMFPWVKFASNKERRKAFKAILL